MDTVIYLMDLKGNREMNGQMNLFEFEEVGRMAAGKCKAAYKTDEWHGYGCEITEGECMFLYPDSKKCAEMYNEGPDSIVESNNECEESD